MRGSQAAGYFTLRAASGTRAANESVVHRDDFVLPRLIPWKGRHRAGARCEAVHSTRGGSSLPPPLGPRILAARRNHPMTDIRRAPKAAKLELSRETLHELTASEAEDVAGGIFR